MDRARTTLRLFVASPAVALRRALAQALDADASIEVVGEAKSSAQALARVPTLAPDVLLAGAHLRNPDSPQLCRQLRTVVPDLHVLMMGVFPPPSLVNAAIRAGASGVLPHTIDIDELVAAVQTTANGQMVMSTHDLQSALATEESSPLRALNQGERTLFGLVGEGLSNREIAIKLNLSEGTVRNYVSRMLRRLRLTRRAEVVTMAARLQAEQRRWYPPHVSG